MLTTSVLIQADIFQRLAQEELELIAGVTSSIECNTGDLIFEGGTAGDELYVIESGEVDIQFDPESNQGQAETRPITVATLRRGQSFGEMALVSAGIRAASARCAQHDTRLIVIPSHALMQLFEQHPRLGYKLMHNLAADLATKIRSTDMLIQERVTWSNVR